jgi:beta-lactamase class A
MKITCLFLLIAAFYFSCQGNRQVSFKNQLQERIDSFEGDVGLYIQNLATNTIIEINADSLYPTASLIKVPILISMFHRLENDTLKYRKDLLWFADSVNYAYDGGILSSFQDGKPIALSKVISLMITYSDNHASLWCQALAGGGAKINNWLAENGFSATRVNSRTPGRSTDWQKYGWGQTTPKEMAQLLVMIRNGKAVSAAASQEMYRILTNIYYYDEALSPIPPYIQTISKQGAVSQSRSEVVLVNAPSGDYVFCIITKNQTDTGWKYDNAGYVLLRDISRMIWNYFEPDHPWQPAANSELYH